MLPQPIIASCEFLKSVSPTHALLLHPMPQWCFGPAYLAHLHNFRCVCSSTQKRILNDCQVQGFSKGLDVLDVRGDVYHFPPLGYVIVAGLGGISSVNMEIVLELGL